MTTKVRLRYFEPGLAPRRTRLDVPGWGGAPEKRGDGAHEQPWHCAPFVEGAQYGIEVFYPYENELRVTRRDGHVALESDWGADPGTSVNWPPFRPFGPGYYTCQLLLDIAVDEPMAVRAEPHPRYFTDETGDVPLAVPALLRTAWWPMISFVVFKAPPAGVTHVFRRGEPFIQLVVVPADPALELAPMPPEEAAARELRARRIHASRDTLGQSSRWTSATGTIFDGTYRNLLRAARGKPV